MKLLTGNTFPIKDEIKLLGGRWDIGERGWMVPDEVYDTLRAKVIASPRSSPCDQRFTCEDCGDEVYRGTECWETGLIH